ncbi:hypothetical protein MMC30_006898 [Trapelia coarctata]|nr:hypothetical protein [Trapelia coarctata]
MAPRANKRDADYSNIGVAGRKTGITLKDTGIRDEHGLEPIDGIFSSPEKSPAKQNGNAHNSTITYEEDMEIGHSTIPEPTELLTANRKRNGKPLLPPPHSRSPIKTSLGSSPRRSMGPLSSPQRNGDTLSRSMPHPLVSRKLDFSADQPRLSVERSPKPKEARSIFGTTSRKGKGKLVLDSGKGRKRPFDFSLDEDEDEEGDSNALSETSQLEDEPEAPTYNDNSIQIGGDQSLEVPDETQQESLETQEQPKAQAGAKKRGRPKSAAKDSTPPPPLTAEREPSVGPPAAKKRAGRPPKKQIFDIPESETASAVEGKSEPPKKRGRKKAELETHHDEEQADGEAGPSRPAKRLRTEPVKVTPTKTSQKAKKPPPSERDPNARIKAAKGKGKEKAPSAEPAESLASVSFAKPKVRSLYVLRHETPAEDDGSRLLRSGRHSVKPIAYWRGERIVYGESHLDGKNIILPPIREVIRTEEVFDQKPKRIARRPGGRPPAKRRPLDDLEEEDEDQEPWELGEGVLRAEVMQWDPVEQKGSEEIIDHVELALAPVAIQDMMKDVKGAEFKFAKTLALPFFHTGVVDLPPGGQKRMKNSRKNHMVFWVFYGRVRVDVAGAEFSIGKGGMWQVPRGNFYSIANGYTNPARIFFAQGCYMSELEELNEAGEEDGEGSGGRVYSQPE